MRRSATSFLALLFLVAFAVPSHAASEQVENELPTIHLFNHNACMNKCNEGIEQRVVEALIDSIRLSDPPLTYVTLQEMCEDGIFGIVGLAERTRHLGYNWEFLPTGPKCARGDRYGLAVGYRGTRSSLQTYTLPNPGGHEPRKMLCVGVTGTSSIACSVHINVDKDATRAAQIRYVSRAVLETVDGKPPLFASGRAIIAGDFNAKPGESVMDPMYQGMHREAFGISNRNNSPATHGSGRIDYVWMTDMRGPDGVTGRVTNSLVSDHKIIRAVIN